MPEWKTRQRLINKALETAKWTSRVHYHTQLDTAKPVLVVEEYPTEYGPADYILFQRSEPIAIVEAKRLSSGIQGAIEQAKRYSRGLKETRFDFHGYKVPFVYSTNGTVIFFQDLRDRYSLPRKVSNFHTPTALRSFLMSDTSKAIAWLKTTPAEGYGLRRYQREAIEHIEDALIDGKRQMMVAMATGTGKTYVAMCQSYRLIKSGLAKKILFLVDRRALAAQAVSAFSSFEPEPGLKFDSIYNVYSQSFHQDDMEDFQFNAQAFRREDLENPDPHQAFVLVCTIQLMRSMIFGRDEFSIITGDEEVESDVDRLDIPIHAFDIIIADECHRGYTTTETGKWREVLDHFDAIKIGLTATPAKHTLAS
jgi:type I restriction enzyme R subunit